VARDGEEAVLVPPADASELRDALRRVLDDQGLRRELSAAGAERASTFSMASLAEAFVARYEAAIRAPRRGSRAARVRSRLGAG
jgi:glycosyltransferase involved in cell wall biosynthesis